MLKPYDTYAPRANAPDANYPLGSIKNMSVPGARDGTPLDNRWGNNIEGFHQALLAEAGIAASGLPDRVGASQLLDAVKALSGGQVASIQVLRLTPPGGAKYLIGHSSPGDGGSGVFLWDSQSTLSDNDGTVIKVTAIATGRWIRDCAANDLHADWFGPNVILDDVVNLLPADGGIVRLSMKRYKPSGYAYGAKFMGKNNVSFIGEKVPEFQADCRRLVNGSIIEGMFLGYADNLTLKNLGIDSGYDVINVYYGGSEAGVEGLLITYPNDTVKAAAPTKLNTEMENVRVLCLSPTSAQHALIAGEGTDGLTLRGIIESCYGIYGVVFKCSNVSAETIAAYSNSNAGVIFKSDIQASAKARNIQISNIKTSMHPPHSAGYINPLVAVGDAVQFLASGGGIENVQIGSINDDLHAYGAAFRQSASNIIQDVQIDNIITEGNSVCAVYANVPSTHIVERLTIGTVTAKNCPVPVYLNADTPTTSIQIGEVNTTNSDVSVQTAGTIKPQIGFVSAKNATEAVYRIGANSRPKILLTRASGTTPLIYSGINGGSITVLGAGVTNSGNFKVEMIGGMTNMIGSVTPSSTTTICTLPEWCRPEVNFICFALGKNSSGVFTAVPITISASTGVVAANEASGSMANCSALLSFDSIKFQS